VKRADTSSLARFSRSLRELSKNVAHDVAKRAAPVITKFANDSFAAQADPYGVPWAPGVDGQKVTLVDTGDMRRDIQYEAIGTKLRVKLGQPYAKYQIGKRPVYPRQGGLLPTKYVEALDAIVADECEGRIIGGAS
jgi:hypothetical protein